ncbi:SpoIID/LytB domain-containing protein [Janibacter alittae]|uniref:SpoIID/LytB domain-containing protein n=1 Tax=Janibacter alittae TaxID=3115209 RepID=A0ABZ2MLG5_9MICO
MVVRSVRLAGVGALLAGLVLGAGAVPAQAGPAASGASGASWEFSGSGFGHGVGMSQYGAKAMADDGKSAAQILKYYYRGISVDRVRDDQLVHVNVGASRPSVTLRTSATQSGGGSFTVTVGSKTLKASKNSTVKVARSGAKVKVSHTAGTKTVHATGPSAQVTFDDGKTLLSIDGKSYQSGSARVVPASGSGVHAVMKVRLHDQYLDNVREMPWSWPAASLQAQAAAARGYALRKVDRGIRSACECHVYDNTSDQVFGTYPGAGASGWDRWKAAVRAGGTGTAGMVPRYHGALIEAVYSSSSGGRTQNNEDVFGGSPVAYLRSVNDPYSMRAENPRRSWTITVSGTKVDSAFGLADVVAVDVARRTTGGGVAEVVATSSTGKRASMTGEQMRRGLGLPSTYVVSPIKGTGPFPDVTAATTDFTKEIGWLKDERITTGYADGTFGPKDDISREAMAAFLYRAAGRPAVESAPDFTDVDSSSAFAREIAWLQDERITTGYADGTFGPKKRISREAMAAFMTRFLLEGRVPDATAPYEFSDIAGTQFEDHIAWIADQGLTTGHADGTFRPKSTITREAMAAFLYRSRDML